MNDNIKLLIEIDIKNDHIIPRLTSGNINNLEDKTALLIALHQLQQDILKSENIQNLNKRLKND